MPGGALANLQKLFLHENKIGDAGVSTLAEAVACGALANLKTSEWKEDGKRLREEEGVPEGATEKQARLA